MAQNYQYFVEDGTEEKIIQVLKTDFQIIFPGKLRNSIRHDFDFSKFLSTKPIGHFSTIRNDSDNIRQEPPKS